MLSFKKGQVVNNIRAVVRTQLRKSGGASANAATSLIGNMNTVGMNNNIPSLVIFDKDGTLLCFHTMWIPWAIHTAKSIEHDSGLSLFKDIAKVLGLCTIENKVKPGLLAEGTMSQITKEISGILCLNGISQQEADKIAENSLKYSNEKSVSDRLVKEIYDTNTLFNRIKQHGSKIAVCTADNRKSSLNALNCMKVHHLVDMVVCGDDKHSLPKPHPHNALRICETLGVKPSEAIMVGDTRVDIEMAHAAQLGAAVGVLSGVGCKNHLHRADVLINNIGDLIEVFYEN
ncbi:unnamed protein product [Caenorhabditis bovis]|uniref:HAD family hydrolase n=1 Tax=Caenorhabditis bovis TaxID=2654633 RepID=A0A8S1FEL0_9PELO|nr:unnamed protein product [Caenorhabditis bovis]